jgi:hypothetical protein
LSGINLKIVTLLHPGNDNSSAWIIKTVCSREYRCCQAIIAADHTCVHRDEIVLITCGVVTLSATRWSRNGGRRFAIGFCAGIIDTGVYYQ